MIFPTATSSRIGVLCGSRGGRTPHDMETASALGKELGLRVAGLIYGAGGVGVMGAVSQAARRAGANVTGVALMYQALGCVPGAARRIRHA